MQGRDNRWKSTRWLVAGVAAVLALGVPIVAVGQGVGASKDQQLKDQRLHATKQAALQREAQAVATARAAPQPPKEQLTGHAKTTKPEPRPLPTWPSGIFAEQQAPFPSTTIAVENQWQANDLGGVHVQVYAGADGLDRSQGLVIVKTTSFDLKTVSASYHPTPLKAGAVRISHEKGELLTLTSKSGATFVFNVASRTFQATS